MTLTNVVIIGAGHGGLQAAVSLREEGFGGDITLLGDEPGLPYQRPPLSKAFMKDGDASRLLLKPALYFERERIAVRERTRVAAIDRAAAEVVTAEGGRLGYDHLILSTGARSRKPPITGRNLRRVVELRTLADAEAIRALLPSTKRAVVIGGGFIGLEFAAVARAAGHEVVVVEAVDRLMARAVSPQISQRFLDAHRAAGAEIRFETLASGVEADGGGAAAAVALSSGERIEADLVLLATGVAPNVELATEAGLAADNGVRVDGQLATEDPRISAIGDCASFPGPYGERLRLESVQAAADQARHLAKRLTGDAPADYAQTPWFWSDQGDLKLQIAGLPSAADAFVAAPGGDTVIGLRGDRLASVETVNAQGAHMAARKLLGLDGGVSRAEIDAAGCDLRALFKARAAR